MAAAHASWCFLDAFLLGDGIDHLADVVLLTEEKQAPMMEV